MNLNRRDRLKHQDVSFTLNRIFKKTPYLKSKEDYRVLNLSFLKTDSNTESALCVEKLAEIKRRKDDIIRATELVEKHILEAQKKALIENESLNNIKKVHLPFILDSLNYHIDSNLLAKNNLLCPIKLTNKNIEIDENKKRINLQNKNLNNNLSGDERSTTLVTYNCQGNERNRRNITYNAHKSNTNNHNKLRRTKSLKKFLSSGKIALCGNPCSPANAKKKTFPPFSLISKSCITNAFIVIPQQVIFTDYEIGKVYEVSLRLKNVSSKSAPLRIIPPQTAHFSISLGKFPSCTGNIAPGLYCEFQVMFSADSMAEFHDCLLVETEASLLATETADTANCCLLQRVPPSWVNCLTVPLKALRDAPILVLPETIQVGDCVVGSFKWHRVVVENKGGWGRFCVVNSKTWHSLEFRSILHQGTYEISAAYELMNPCFQLGSFQSVELLFLFRPRLTQDYNETLCIVCDNCNVRSVELRGSGKMPSLELLYVEAQKMEDCKGGLDADEVVKDTKAPIFVTLPTTSPGQTGFKMVTLRNNLNCNVDFFWRNVHSHFTYEAAAREDVSHSSFSVEPPSGTFQACSPLSFHLLFTPQETNVFQSVLQLCLEYPDLSSAGCEQTESRCQMPVLEIEVLARSENPRVCMQPSVVTLAKPILIHCSKCFLVKLLNEGACHEEFQWMQSGGDVSFLFEPSSGILDAKSGREIKVFVTSERVGVFDEAVKCCVGATVCPLVLRVVGEFKAPQVTLSPSCLDLGLLMLHQKGSGQVCIDNPSPNHLSWSLRDAYGRRTRAISIEPPEGYLRPQEMVMVQVAVQSDKQQYLERFLRLYIARMPTEILLPVRAVVQEPLISVDPCKVVFKEAMVSKEQVLNLCIVNHSAFCVPFQWKKQEENDKASCALSVQPTEACLPPFLSIPFSITCLPYMKRDKLYQLSCLNLLNCKEVFLEVQVAVVDEDEGDIEMAVTDDLTDLENLKLKKSLENERMDFVLLDECSGVKYILIKNNSRRRVVVECGAEYYNWKRTGFQVSNTVGDNNKEDNKRNSKSICHVSDNKNLAKNKKNTKERSSTATATTTTATTTNSAPTAIITTATVSNIKTIRNNFKNFVTENHSLENDKEDKTFNHENNHFPTHNNNNKNNNHKSNSKRNNNNSKKENNNSNKENNNNNNRNNSNSNNNSNDLINNISNNTGLLIITTPRISHNIETLKRISEDDWADGSGSAIREGSVHNCGQNDGVETHFNEFVSNNKTSNTSNNNNNNNNNSDKIKNKNIINKNNKATNMKNNRKHNRSSNNGNINNINNSSCCNNSCNDCNDVSSKCFNDGVVALAAGHLMLLKVACLCDTWGNYQDLLLLRLDQKDTYLPFTVSMTRPPLHCKIMGPSSARNSLKCLSKEKEDAKVVDEEEESAVFRFGSSVAGCEAQCRKVEVLNTSSVDVCVQWTLLRQEPEDCKVVQVFCCVNDVSFPPSKKPPQSSLPPICEGSMSVAQYETPINNFYNFPINNLYQEEPTNISLPVSNMYANTDKSLPVHNMGDELMAEGDDDDTFEGDTSKGRDNKRLVSVKLLRHRGNLDLNPPFELLPTTAVIRAKRTFTFEATFTPASSLPPDQDTLSHCFLGHSFITVVSPLACGDTVSRPEAQDMTPFMVRLQATTVAPRLRVEYEEEEEEEEEKEGMKIEVTSQEFIDQDTGELLEETTKSVRVFFYNETPTEVFFKLSTSSNLHHAYSYDAFNTRRSALSHVHVLEHKQKLKVEVEVVITRESFKGGENTVDWLNVKFCDSQGNDLPDYEMNLEVKTRNILPVLCLNERTVHMGKVLIGEHVKREIPFGNYSKSFSLWRLVREEGDACSVVVEPVCGLLKSATSLCVSFAPSECKRYQSRYRFEGEFGEGGMEIVVCGEGTNDECHRKV